MRSILTTIVVLAAVCPAWAGDPSCMAKLKQAAAAGLIKDMKATTEGMEFVVDENVFPKTAFSSKQGMVRTINCAMLEPGKQFNPIIFRGHLSNKILAKQDRGTLTVN